MTSQKQLKARVRARMAKTGERYAVARGMVVGESAPPRVDLGWTLRGGTDPDAYAVAALLAHLGITGPGGPLSEPLVFGIGGGIGAGYILWEFQHDDSRVVTLGFHNQWQYFGRRVERTLQRLGVNGDWHRTGGVKAAEARLTAELDAGRPALVWPDRYHIGYWDLPAFLDGRGGHPVIVYGRTGDRVHVDDRTLAPLTVARADLDRARARVGTYRNTLLVLDDQPRVLDAGMLREAMLTGLRDVVAHLSASSDSFSLPAWRKWARMLTDRRNSKAWPRVFADRVGLVGALLSVWEGIEPAGMTGGNLRPLFADFLTEAGGLLDSPALVAHAKRWHDIAELWHSLAETALPPDSPLARIRDLSVAVSSSVAQGDEGAADRTAATAELWDRRAQHTISAPFDDDTIDAMFTAMSAALTRIYQAETNAIAELGTLIAGG